MGELETIQAIQEASLKQIPQLLYNGFAIVVLTARIAQISLPVHSL
jgi:hypothetical protein